MSYRVSCDATINLKKGSCSEEYDLIESIANECFEPCSDDVDFSFKDSEDLWSWNGGDVHKVALISLSICYFNYDEDELFKFFKQIEPYIDDEQGAEFLWNSMEDDGFWKHVYHNGRWEECDGVRTYKEGTTLSI